MSPILLISLLEALLVVTLIATVLYLKWREKRHRHADFEILLEDINDRQGLRGNKISRRLVDKYRLDPAIAQNLSERLITEEKQFLQQFIEQQMQQQSVANFYENLCVLLDSYLISPAQATPKTKTETPAEKPPQAPEQPAPEIDDEDIADGDALISDEPAPTWGDVFDE